MRRYKLYRRLGGPPGQDGRVRKICYPPLSLLGFYRRTVRPLVSRHAFWVIPPTAVSLNTSQIKISRESNTQKIFVRGYNWIFSESTSSTNIALFLKDQRPSMYTRVNNNPSAWNFLSPKPEVTCGTDAIIIRVVLLSPHLRIRAVSLSSIHYNQSHRVYINRRRRYICLIWN